MQLPDHQKLDGSPEFFSRKSLGQAPDGKYFQSLPAWVWGGSSDLKVKDCLACPSSLGVASPPSPAPLSS